jgi:hypothetical protein
MFMHRRAWSDRPLLPLSLLVEVGPSLSESGLIRLCVSLDVVWRACARLRRLNESGPGGAIVSVNVVLSGVSLCRI